MSLRKSNRKTCPGKNRYSREEAFAAKKRYEQETGALMSAYKCTNCQFWHIGHHYPRKP